MTTDTVAIVCIALLGILLFLLGANVTRHRAIRGDTGNQMPSDPADRMFIAQPRARQRRRVRADADRAGPRLRPLSDGWWVDALAVAAVVVALPARDRDADRQDPRLPRTRP